MTALALGFTLLQATEDGALPAAVAATRPAPKVDSAPDRAAAHAAARRQGSRVEIEEGATERVARFANPDGSTTVEAHYGDVRVRKDGAWVEIDPALVEQSGKLKTRATRASVEISPEGTSQSAPLARVAKDGRSLALDWPTTLPEASVDGAAATFDLAGPEQVQVTATNDGFNLRVRLDEAPKQAPVYRLPVLAPDLRLVKQPDGGYHAVDAKKNVVFVVEPLEMWDSDPATMDEGWQTARVPVDSEVVETRGGGQELVLRPSMEWLTDPSRVAPIWIDPDVSTQDNARDAYIREGKPDSTAASTPTLSVGWGGSTNERQRALIEHDELPTLPAGSVVTGAKLTLRQRDAATCTPVAMNVYPINESWTSSVTWNIRPSYSTSSATKGTATFNHGLEPGCANAYQDIDITGMAQAWYATTDPKPYNGLTLMASPETATDGFKSFCSFNVDPDHSSCDRDTRMPKLTITYDAPPEKATNLVASPAAACKTGSGRPFVNSLVPLLSGSAAHTDGIPTRLQIELRTLSGSSNLATGTTGYVPAGATTSWQVPGGNLSNGNTYRWRAKGDDATQLSPSWSSWCEFTVDTVAPGAPVLSSSDYPGGGWAGGAGTSGAFAMNPPNSDSGGSGVTGVQWSLDGGTPTTVATTGSTVNVAIVPSTDGKHVLTVHTLDKAGNLSTPATHTFYVGVGGLLTPALGARTAGAFNLSAIVKDATEVRFQYRRSETENWANLSETYFPVTGGTTTPYTWDAAAALGDGALQLRPVMFGGTSGGSGSAPVSVTVDQHASAAAKDEVGPGSLDLLTGDYTLSDTDASFFGISLSRTATSRDPQAGTRTTGQAAPFGPAWATGGVAEMAASDWKNVAVSGNAATLSAADGGKISFAKTSTGSGSSTLWQPEIGAEDLALTGSSSTGFTLRDSEATVTVFSGTASPFPVSSSTPTGGDANATLFTWESAGGGLNRLARIIAPTTAVSPLSGCATGTTPAAGCRVLQLNYASSSTTPPASGTTGDYADRVKTLTLYSMDPSTGATVGTDVAAYAYDSNGRLAQAWDPRISPALKTVYGYDTDGRVAGLTPPGERPWTFVYDTSGAIGSVNNGRLLKASRDTLVSADPTATTSVVYDAPLSGTGAAADLSAGTVAAWGQSDVPVTATAVFPPDAVRSTHYGAQGPWTKATVHYLNVDGREVNTLTPGGGIDTVEYDAFGNTVRELSATNRALALAAASDPQLLALGLTGASTAARAQALSATTAYDATGQRALESFGPLRVTVLPDGTSPARSHTVNAYDEGRPTGDGPKDLVTTTSTGARAAGATSDVDVRTTTTEYDWTLGLATKATVDPSGLNIATKTAYDSRGRAIRTDMPKAVAASSTTGAGSTTTEYYATGTNPSACQKTAWEGLVCRTSPAGAIVGGGSNPSTLITETTTYDHLGAPVTIVETSGSTTRTTTTTYASGRVDTVTTTGSGIGTAVPTVVTGYDTSTGRVVSTTDTAPNPDVVITREFDELGRQTAYVDATGGRTETVYDWLGQIASTRQYSNGSTPLTTTYSYDADTKLLTGLVDPVAGTFTATYDLDGQLLGQAMPGGVTMTQSLDTTATPLTRSYATSGAVLMTETVAENVHGQWIGRTRADSAAAGSEQAYSALREHRNGHWR